MYDNEDRYTSLIVDDVVAETPKAIRVRMDDELLWIPKSVIHESDSWVVEGGEQIELNIKQWFANKEGL